MTLSYKWASYIVINSAFQSGFFSLIFLFISFFLIYIFNKIITIHHECPCRTEKSHPRGRNFYQGRGLPSPGRNSKPESEMDLSYMDWLMMDYFSPTFSEL